MSLSDSVRSTVEQLRESASVESVFGDPVETDGRTLVPVARVSYGFGGGFGRGPSGDETRDETAWEPGEPSGMEAESGEGGGGGGGVSARPVGVLEVSADGTRFVRFGDRRRLAVAGLAGFLLGLLVARRSGGSE